MFYKFNEFKNDVQVTKEFALTAIMKLTTRFTTCNDQIQLIINNYTTNTDVELQQRSVEYDAIFRKFEPLRPGLLERMPLISSEPSPSDGPDEGYCFSMLFLVVYFIYFSIKKMFLSQFCLIFFAALVRKSS